jgi:PhoH-like ATPase
MKKTFILDTNVLLHDPNAYSQFGDNNVIIPLPVLEEIDRFKKELTELGRSARQVSRSLDELRKQGRLSDGIKLETGGTLRVYMPPKEDPFGRRIPVDDFILKTGFDLQQADPESVFVIISKDINLRLKSDALGVRAEDYENGHIDSSEFYAGYRVLDVDVAALEQFVNEGRIEPPEEGLLANQYVIMRDKADEGHVELGRYDSDADRIVSLILPTLQMTSIQPRNIEQKFAFDALMNDDVKLVTLSGKAGTGKTLLAVAVGVFKTLDDKKYKKLLVSRPTFPMGKDLGYLPGDIEEKLNPWMQPIQDALDLIRHGRSSESRRGRDYLASDQVNVEPLTYIRGRSIPNQFIIIDESQNLTPLEVKTVITRVGHGTKIVLTGDIYQIDNPYVDVLSNGLNAVTERFREYPVAAHVMLKDGVRSKVAELAANVL